MNTELIITLFKLLNVIFCLFLIALIIWHNTKQKTHSNTLIIFLSLLFILMIGQIIYSTNLEIANLFVSFIIILIVLLNINKLKSSNFKHNETTQSDELINQAKEQERSRIYANLHDDVGAKLLELIYSAKDEKSKALAKQVLSDIRQAVASTVNIQCNLNQLANEIMEETQMRLNAASINVFKDIQLDRPKKSLASNIPIAISRICREVISNVIKHSKASQVNATIISTDKALTISIKDNGIGILEKNKSGKGLKTINKRAESISSVVEWYSDSKNPSNKGTKFTLTYNYGNH